MYNIANNLSSNLQGFAQCKTKKVKKGFFFNNSQNDTPNAPCKKNDIYLVLIVYSK